MEADILGELQSSADCYRDWAEIGLEKTNLHIAVMSEPFLSYVFNGNKTVESRFSLHKIAPYNQAKPGDLVFMKNGPVVGCFKIAWVKNLDLVEHPVEVIKKEYGDQIYADDDFWNRKSSSRYATLMGIDDVHRLTPIKISKLDRRGWMRL